MNILHRFTRKSLLANRSRTLVTIIGIILSMALFTAVIEGAYSGQQFLIRSVEEREGRWLVFDAELTQKQADELRRTDGIADSAVWQEVGWGSIIYLAALTNADPQLMEAAIVARSEASTNISPTFWWSPSMMASRVCCPSDWSPADCRKTRTKFYCLPILPQTAVCITARAIR